jgi:TonB family protein
MANLPEGVVLVRLVAPPRERLWSRPALVAAALLASAQFGVVVPPTLRTDAGPSGRHEFQEAVYLLPLWPTQTPRPRTEPVRWATTGKSLRAGLGGTGAHIRRVRERGENAERATAGAPVPVPEPETYDGSRVYIEPELEHPAARDPASDGPLYPDYLRARGIEGSVVIRFIVDTLGHADSTTLRIVETSHPGFADAVRTALPRMLFIPAQLDGRPVPQLVMREFRFILTRADSLAARAQARRHT